MRLGYRALLIASVLVIASLQTSWAQLLPESQNLAEIVLTEGQTSEIKPGGYRFKAMTLKANATLQITGSTSLLVGKIITEKGAKIEYIKGSAPKEAKTFSLS